MGTDDLFHKRKARSADLHRREKAKREPYERILIVCEGLKTEPTYFKALRKDWGLHPANVVIDDKKSGLDPKSLVEFTLQTLRKDKDFDQVFCVFDKDRHVSYPAALDRIRSIRLKKPALHAINSVPCFEVWLLLHFTYTTHPFRAGAGASDCALVIAALNRSDRLIGYEKGNPNTFTILQDRLATALDNADRLDQFHRTSGTDNPSTQVHRLICHLKTLQRRS